MLALVGALAIVALLAAILSNRVSPLAALILVPVVAAMAVGAGPLIPTHILEGISKIAPVAGMFVFAILFFGIMTDAGVLAPLVGLTLRLVGRKPARITVGTAALALLIHLDGSGAVCFLVTIPALRPLYDELGMDRRILACTASMAAGVNFLPWTGPTLRAAAALKVTPSELFTPMLPTQIVGLAFVFAASWWLGRREERRIANGTPLPAAAGNPEGAPSLSPASEDHAPVADVRRPRLLWLNAALTLLTIAVMVTGTVEPVIAFMIGTALALAINYPDAAQQRARIESHSKAALLMASVLLAAGAFTGIMNGTGMIAAMAQSVADHIPPGVGRHLPVMVGAVAMPLSMMFDPDSFYFGIMPILAHLAGTFGIEGTAVARAALLGQMTTGFPVSPLTPATFLVAGLSGIELSAHQRFSFLWLYAASLVMLVAALVFGVLAP
ncbi:CitMHS family transporter [Novosphingobium kaempferiae]|uniref:CitMHS family transporter n=1 Tax=Novosphingobium kaempferiae TaxID=2896849 RepID=UPI001E3B0BD9|nr:citrate:proton symporter [Novosphingobium kaempferiae]